MKVVDLINQLNLTVFTNEADLNKEVTGGYVSDLLSDVMGNAEEGSAWITIQNHLNVVAIASLKELACIILVKGIEPSAEVLEKAASEGVAVLGSKEKTFEITGKLYQLIKDSL